MFLFNAAKLSGPPQTWMNRSRSALCFSSVVRTSPTASTTCLQERIAPTLKVDCQRLKEEQELTCFL